MSYDDNLRHLLKAIDNEAFNEENILPEVSRNQVMKMLNDCEKQGFISHSSSKQKIVTGFMGGGFALHPSTFVTRPGKKFIEGKEDAHLPTHQYNIHSVSGSNFGDHGTITNNYGASISDFKTLIESISNSSDKAEASELVEIIEAKEPIKPGLLKRFDSLLEKYPALAKTAGQLLLSYSTGMIE